MSWEKIDANDTGLLTPPPIPAGQYTLQLMGAAPNKFKPESTDVAFVVADEGSEYRGRKVFLELPDPNAFPWSAGIYARIVKSLGATVTPGLEPQVELTRLANNGHSRLTADIYIETFTRKDGSEGSKSKINSRSLRAAA